MISPHCIITGCELIAPGFTQHGDLWELGAVWIFNAVGEPDYDSTPPESAKCIHIKDAFHENYWERRNVYVFAKAEAGLNQTAQNYIQGVGA